MISLSYSQIGELMCQFLLSGTVTLSFAILFACPRRSLPTCALVGAMGWFVYELCVMLGLGTAAASLLAVIPLTILTRVFAILQKPPVTVFLLSGIFPLLFVPAAAGGMELWAEMGNMLLPIIIAIIPVTVLVMVSAGRTTQAMTGRKKKEAGHAE